MTTTTKHKVKGETLWISADFAQASSTIYVAFFDPADEPNAWQPTPFQVADAGHKRDRAAKLVAKWGASQ